MHERRNTCVTILLVLAIIWAFYVWWAAPAMQIELPAPLLQRAFSALLLAVLAGAVYYCLGTSDTLDDALARTTAGRYFERDGLCFMPLTRVVRGPDGPQAEISLYYQSRYEGECEAVVHLRAPGDAIRVHDGAPGVRFAFRCNPGAFGVVHQPIGVPADLQGRTVEVELGAAVRWPRGHGEQLRSREGAPCGKVAVDWTRPDEPGSGKVELRKPALVHLALPENVRAKVAHAELLNETLAGL